MEFIFDLFDYPILGNRVGQWALVLGVLALILALLLLLRDALVQRLRRHSDMTVHRLDDLLSDLAERLRLSLLFLVLLYFAALNLSLPANLLLLLRIAALVATLVQVGIWGGAAAHYGARFIVTRRLDGGGEGSATAISALSLMGSVLIWGVVLILILDNIPGIEVNSLVAGLGITGIAVALAVQNVLGDLIAYISIVLDQPFEIGDIVKIDDFVGFIRRIGLKTTRVEAISGEQVIFSNSDMLSSRVQNLGRADARRAIFILGVAYETPTEKLRRIPDIVREVIDSQALSTFERCNFKSYGDFALIFEISMKVNSQAFNDLFNSQHDINLGLHERFGAEGIEFAYPTQTLYVKQLQQVG